MGFQRHRLRYRRLLPNYMRLYKFALTTLPPAGFAVAFA